MRKIFNIIIILILFISACEQQQAPVKMIDNFDYQTPSKTIIEINEKIGNQKTIEASKLNLLIAREKSLRKKADLLKDINNITKNTSNNN